MKTTLELNRLLDASEKELTDLDAGKVDEPQRIQLLKTEKRIGKPVP